MSEQELREALAAAKRRIAELESGKASTSVAFSKLVFDHAPGGIAVVSLNGRILHCNAEGARILGRAPDELVGRNTALVYADPDDKVRLRTVLAEGGVVRDYQIRMKHADDKEVWVSLNASPVMFEDSPAAVVSFTDITEFKLAINSLQAVQEGVEAKIKLRTSSLEEANEELAILHLQLVQRDRERELAKKALQESEERFRALFENKHSVMLIIDPADGRIVDANHAAADFYGYGIDVLKTMTIMEINTLSPGEIVEEMRRVKDGERQYFEFRHRLSSGEIRDVEVFSGPVQAHGKPLLYSIIHDISSRKRTEEKMRVYERVIMSTPDLISLVDRNYTYRMVNDSYLRTFARKREEIEGFSVPELLGQETFEAVSKENLDKAFAGETVNVDNSIITPDGRPVHLTVAYHPVKNDVGEIYYVAIDARDVTEIRQSEHALQEFSDRLALATDAGMIGIWELDLPSGNLIWDDITLKLFQVDIAEYSGLYQAWRGLIHPDDLVETEELLQQSIENNTPFEAEYRIVWPNNEVRFIKADALMQTDGEGKVVRVTGVNQDVTENRRLEEELRTLATTDPLTGAFNRRRFMERGAEEFNRGKRYDTSTTMLSLDIDHFKRINDTHGHPVGDIVLRALVAICKQTLRATDIFARMGGEEFSAILPETTLEDGLKTAERLRVAVEESCMEAGGVTIKYTISLGVSDFHADDDSITDVMRRVDQALYAAKDAGRNRVMSR